MDKNCIQESLSLKQYRIYIFIKTTLKNNTDKISFFVHDWLNGPLSESSVCSVSKLGATISRQSQIIIAAIWIKKTKQKKKLSDVV